MIKLLFGCAGNANRSRMAQALARLHGGSEVDAY
jgi:protein-tyrosine-phosphatase